VAPRLYDPGYWLNPPFATGLQLLPNYPTPFAGGGGPSAISQGEGINYNFGSTPYDIQYNFNIQRDLGAGMILTVGYVGSEGVHLVLSADINPAIPTIGPDGNQVFGYLSPTGTSVLPNPRINPLYSSLSEKEPWAHSNYNSLQTSLNHRFSHNVQTQLSYTFSKSMDDNSTTYGIEGDGNQNITNPYNASLDRSVSSFNRTNVFNGSAVYAFPFHQNRLVSGWQLTGIFSASSGLPLLITDGLNRTGEGGDRPNYVSGCNPYVGTLTEWVNPSCFTLPPVGEYGNLGRNVVFGPGAWNLDSALLKDTKIAEHINLQFRAEFFNIFNHPDFSNPTVTLYTATAGGGATVSPNFDKITSTTNTARQIQFGLKLLF
jgi:hypothetical protein